MSKSKSNKGFAPAINFKEEKVKVTPSVTEGDYINQIAKQKLNKDKSQGATTQTQNSDRTNTSYTGVAITQETDENSDDEPEPSAPSAQPVAIDPSQLQEMINSAIATAVSPLQKQLSDRENQHQQELENLNNQLSDRDREVQDAQAALTDAQQELEQAQQSTQTTKKELQELNNAVTSAKETIDKFEALYQLSGSKVPKGVKEGNNLSGTPNINQYTSVYGDSYKGSIAEFHQILDTLPKARKNTARGVVYYSYDPRQLDAFVKENRSHVMRDLENFGREHGFFQGNSSRIVTQAPTTIGDVPGGFLDVLSSLARLTNRKGFVFHQFINTQIEFDKGMGNNIQVYRADYQPRPASPEDRLLSGGGVYSRISNGGQSINTGVVNVELQEWGLGKDGVSDPIELPSFVQAYSMIELMQIIERNLVYDYYAWEDLKIRSLWSPTSRVVYNNGYRVTANAADLVANSSGTMQKGFLTNLFGYMQDLEIPTLPDGCYGLVMPTTPATQFKNELDDHWDAPSEAALKELTNMMRLDSYGESPRAVGYLGEYCNFHIFHTNAYGTGIPGTEGVQDEALGAGTFTTRASYAFGSNTIGRGVGQPMEIRRDTNDDFQRLNRYIWRSEEGFDALDVDPTGYGDTSPVPQQLRVLEVRTTDIEQ